MNLLRRPVVAVLALTLLLAGAAQRSAAQALKQLPADPLVVIKFNNPEAISKKVADFAKRLGVDKFNPDLAADPLAALKKELNLNEGFDATGEVVFALYEAAKKADNAADADDTEPRMVALLPIASYEGFLKNFKNVKSEGNLSTFTLPDDDDTMYAANWGKYAAFTDKRGMDLIKQKGAGIEVLGLAAKQMQGQDAVVYANAKLLAARVLPEFKTQRVGWIDEMQKQLAADQNFPQKYAPVLKAAVNQMLNVAEQTLTDAQAATFGITLTPEKGINTTVVAEFEPSSYLGKLWAGTKNSNESLIAGLPNRKYFAFGGAVIDQQTGTKLFDDLVGPITKELQALGNDAQAVNTLVDAVRTSISATNSFAFAYAAPTAPPGQQSLIQQVIVYNGDAKKIGEASTKSFEGIRSLMKMVPQTPGVTMNMQLNKGTKTVDGVTLDEMVMDVKTDPNNQNPEAAQAQQIMQMVYGPKGMGGYMGAVSDKAYIGVTGGNDELLAATVKSAKANDASLAQQAQIKAVADALPQNRALVYFIDIGNIASTGLQFAAQMGMAMPMKLPQDMPPIGISAGTEGSAIRIDTHLSTELITNIVSTAAQAAMMMQGGQQQPGQL